MKILKFGGSSVANAKTIARVIDILVQEGNQRQTMVVVVSALGGVTDSLVKMGVVAAKSGNARSLLNGLVKKHQEVVRKLITPKSRSRVLAEVKLKAAELEGMLHGVSLIRELSPRSLDAIMSYGEQLSAYLMAEACNDRGIKCRYVDSRSLIKTDESFGQANVDMKSTHELITRFFRRPPELCVMGGFIASTHDGVTTTLGRGGSDYTAALVGAALNATVIELWTDVDGVMTADPRKVDEAFPLSHITYEEAGELAHFGAKVIHPKTMRPARLKNIPIVIKNTFNPRAEGTEISNKKLKHDFPVKGISSLSDIALLRIQSTNGKKIADISARVFDVLNRGEIDVLLTTQASAEQSISIALNGTCAQRAKHLLERAFELEMQTRQMGPVSVQKDLSIVAVVGERMKGIPGISGKLFHTLGQNNVNIVAIAQGSSELNISTVIAGQDEQKAVNLVHETFFSQAGETVHLFLVGTGLIGSALLKHVQESERYYRNRGVRVRLCGLANSQSMVFDPRGISLAKWKRKLARGTPMDIRSFVDQMKGCNLYHSVFVDCTPSESVASVYESVLEARIAIVTPNKQANSGPFKRYARLRELAHKNGVPFLYETTVGAALPVINSIQNLVSSGDRITTIQAVLSGTLSYVFNTFSDTEASFSDIVRDARAKGYTEPDPKDDLSGLDVTRKILILAREAGLDMEPGDVRVEPLLPEECLRAKSLDDFFVQLRKADAGFEERKRKASLGNRRLHYVAMLADGRATVSLREVGPDHPFYSLSGSDNIVSITTRRYNRAPLVVKGPGAGADVTAGGVLADIILSIR